MITHREVTIDYDCGCSIKIIVSKSMWFADDEWDNPKLCDKHQKQALA